MVSGRAEGDLYRWLIQLQGNDAIPRQDNQRVRVSDDGLVSDQGEIPDVDDQGSHGRRWC